MSILLFPYNKHTIITSLQMKGAKDQYLISRQDLILEKNAMILLTVNNQIKIIINT